MYEPPDQLSTENYQHLIDRFPQGRFVSFIGAGASKPTGIPSWKEMLEQLINLKGLDLRVDGYEGRYPELASAIYTRYEELACDNEYYDYLVSISEPTVCHSTSLHHALITTIPVHVTTNFDCVLEKAYVQYKEGITPSCQFFPHFNIDDLGDHSIVYLHANREARRFVFRKEEFDSYYPSVSRVQGSSQIESFLGHLFKSRHILFIGCGFNDQYLTGCLEAISRQIALETEIEVRSFGQSLGTANVFHYALLHEQVRHDRRRLKELIEHLEGCQVHTICYRRHSEIDDILLELRGVARMGQAVSDR